MFSSKPPRPLHSIATPPAGSEPARRIVITRSALITFGIFCILMGIAALFWVLAIALYRHV